MSRSALEACVLAALLLAASPDTPTAGDRLARAELCYAALDFACAEEELSAARGAADTLAGADRERLWQLSAEVALSEDRRADALAHLDALLTLAPAWRPPPGAWPDAWRQALETARRLAPDRLPPTLSVTLPAALMAGEAFEVTATVTDPSGVARVRLSVASEGVTRTLPMATTDGTTWRATVAAELVTPPSVALWAEAWDQQGNGPAAWGSAGVPRRVPVDAPIEVEDDPAIHETWWFWTAVGAVVIGGIVAAVLLTDEGDGGATSPPEAGDLNVVLLPP